MYNCTVSARYVHDNLFTNVSLVGVDIPASVRRYVEQATDAIRRVLGSETRVNLTPGRRADMNIEATVPHSPNPETSPAGRWLDDAEVVIHTQLDDLQRGRQWIVRTGDDDRLGWAERPL